MLFSGHTEGCGWVDSFSGFFFMRCGAAFAIFLSKGVTLMKINQSTYLTENLQSRILFTSKVLGYGYLPNIPWHLLIYFLHFTKYTWEYMGESETGICGNYPCQNLTFPYPFLCYFKSFEF